MIVFRALTVHTVYTMNSSWLIVFLCHFAVKFWLSAIWFSLFGNFILFWEEIESSTGKSWKIRNSKKQSLRRKWDWVIDFGHKFWTNSVEKTNEFFLTFSHTFAHNVMIIIDEVLFFTKKTKSRKNIRERFKLHRNANQSEMFWIFMEPNGNE